jgi:hypothetical protein
MSCGGTAYSVQLLLGGWQNLAKMQLDHLGFQNAIELTSCNCNYASFRLSSEGRYQNQASKRHDHLWIEWEVNPMSCQGTEYSVQLLLGGWQKLAKTQQDHLGFQNANEPTSCDCTRTGSSFWLLLLWRY